MSSPTPPKRSTPKKSAPKRKPTAAAKPSQPKTKLGAIVAALLSSKGATVPDLMELTGWQSHSVRGALAGAIRKRGYNVSSTKTKAGRFYRAEISK